MQSSMFFLYRGKHSVPEKGNRVLESQQQSFDTQAWASASLPPSTQAVQPRAEALTTDVDSLHPVGWKSKMEADLVPGGSRFLVRSWLQACVQRELCSPSGPPPYHPQASAHLTGLPSHSALPSQPCRPPSRIPWLPQRETPQDRPRETLMEMRAGVP